MGSTMQVISSHMTSRDTDYPVYSVCSMYRCMQCVCVCWGWVGGCGCECSYSTRKDSCTGALPCVLMKASSMHAVWYYPMQ